MKQREAAAGFKPASACPYSQAILSGEGSTSNHQLENPPRNARLSHTGTIKSI
jgi:hypothetical protein